MMNSKQEELNQKIKQREESMMSQLTNENRSEKQIKKQFYFMAQNHQKYPFMEDDDLTLYRESMKSIQLQNFFIFSLSSVTSAFIYKLAGGFTPSEKRPWLRRFRHFSAIGIPSFLLSIGCTALYQGEAQKNIVNLSQKYKQKLLDPEFNKKFIHDLSERYRHQKQI